MATKTVKKTSAKKPVAKKAVTTKPVAAKPVVKKTAAKKTVTKKAAAPVAKMAPVATPETHNCRCGNKCPCGKNCACGHDCHCGDKCRCCGGFGRTIMRVLWIIIVVAIAIAALRLCCCGPRHHGPRVHFTNGCLDVESVKCPKLASALPAMDINQDGCITRDEFRAVKRHMRAEIRDIPVQGVDDVAVQAEAETETVTTQEAPVETDTAPVTE